MTTRTITIPAGTVLVLDIKGLELSTPLPTPTGWTTIGAVAVGDLVIGRDGKPCTVVAKSQIRNRDCYRITFDDLTSVVADDEHRWCLSLDSGDAILTTREMFERDRHRRVTGRQRDLRIVNAAPLDLPEVALPIEPYLLGAWLGDGHARGGEISKPLPALWDEIERRGHVARTWASGIKSGTRSVVGLGAALRAAGLTHNKHIPAPYLRASRSQRLDLLRGLMDTDGCWNKPRRQAQFSTTDKALAGQVYELIVSLGWRAHVSEVQRKGFGLTVTAYDVTFTHFGDCPFIAKADRVTRHDGTNMSRRRLVVDIAEVGTVPTQCIAVDSPDHTYLCTESMLPTHNTGGLNPNYSRKYAPQLAAYAGACRYDPDTDTRSAWPWPIDQDVALIAHIPVADLLATGRCDISLVPVDLAAGRHAAELCVAAKAWNARRDIFGTPVPVVTAEVAPLTPEGRDLLGLAQSMQPDPFDGINGEATQPRIDVAELERLTQQARTLAASLAAAQRVDPFDAPGDDRARPRLTDRAATLKATHPDAAKWVAARWPQGVPALKGDAPLTDGDLDAIDRVLTAAEAHFAAPFGEHDMSRPTRAAKPVDTPERATWQRPEEGPTIHEDDVAELRASIKRLPGTASARVQAWLGQAIAAGRPVLPADKAHTLRSVTIVQAMANCALVDDFVGDDEFLKVVLSATLGTDAAQFANVSVGACFGSLTIAEATRLHAVAERYAEGRVRLGFGDDGAPIFLGETTDLVPLAA